MAWGSENNGQEEDHIWVEVGKEPVLSGQDTNSVLKVQTGWSLTQIICKYLLILNFPGIVGSCLFALCLMPKCFGNML